MLSGPICHPSKVRTYCLLIYFLFLRFNDHLPGGPGLTGTTMSPYWILLQQRMMEEVNWSYKMCKAPVKLHHLFTYLFYFVYFPSVL